MVSQPYDRDAKVPLPGKLDPSLGEFWVENPWEIIQHGHNLSCYERDRTFLNVRGTSFLEISHLTGADHDGDGRCVVAADFRNDGRLDLLVRQVGGGSVLLFENQFPKRHYLKVSLRGKGHPNGSNRLGIGARITATLKDQTLVREMYPLNSYRSQLPSLAHFGLGDADVIDKLTVQWPSGKTQDFRDVKADRHIVVSESEESDAALSSAVPGQIIPP